MNLVILFIIVITIIIYIRISSNKSIYPRGGQQDYQYLFKAGKYKKNSINLNNDKFNWPELDQTYDTVFLKIDISSTFMGRLLEPYIEWQHETTRRRQFFERDAQGSRYLNMSDLLQHKPKAGDCIKLAAQHLTYQSDKCELILFNNPSLQDKRVLVIGTHPDDAEISAYGLYKSTNSYIITITAGDSCEPGDHKYLHIYPDLKEHYLEKGKLRCWDSVVVPLLANVAPDNIANMGYFDGRIKTMYENPDKIIDSEYSGLTETGVYRQYNSSKLLPSKSTQSTWYNLVNDLVYLIDKIKPDIIVSKHPLLDSHADHQYSAVAMAEALQKTQHKNCILYLYANHYYSMDSIFPYGPAHATMPLSPWFDESVEFSSIYSHPLSLQDQKQKIFALGCMHDLRPAPEAEIKTLTATDFIEALKWRNILNTIKGIDHSYYRRAIRANELFYVVDVDEHQQLVDKFLQQQERKKND